MATLKEATIKLFQQLEAAPQLIEDITKRELTEDLLSKAKLQILIAMVSSNGRLNAKTKEYCEQFWQENADKLRLSPLKSRPGPTKKSSPNPKSGLGS